MKCIETIIIIIIQRIVPCVYSSHRPRACGTQIYLLLSLSITSHISHTHSQIMLALNTNTNSRWQQIYKHSILCGPFICDLFYFCENKIETHIFFFDEEFKWPLFHSMEIYFAHASIISPLP